jgi:hypothetical protein
MDSFQQNQSRIIEGQDRTVGRAINFGERIEELLDIISKQIDKDPYNSIENFNIYERGVRRFETFLRGYIDEEYLEERNEIQIQDDDKRRDKIHMLDNRFDLCMKLMKRKRFTPVDDVMETSFWIVNDIVKRIRDELDAQVLVHGKRGTGKSTVCLELAFEIAQKMGLIFDVSKHVFFNSTDLRNYIADAKPQPGQPLIWDEAGAGKGMGRRRAMTRESVEYNEVIQLIREMGLVMFYTVPFDTQLDSGTVSMFSCNIETVRLDRHEKINTVKYKILDGIMWKYLHDHDGNRINRIIIGKPEEGVIKEYKAMKTKFVQFKIRPEDKSNKGKPEVNYEEITNEIRENTKQFSQKRTDKTVFIKELIYEAYKHQGLTNSKASEIKRKLEVELNG